MFIRPSKKMFAIAFYLSLATALLQLSSQFLSWQRMDDLYSVQGTISSGETMLRDEVKMMPVPEPVMWERPGAWQQDDALEVDQRLYSTSSFSQLVVRDVSGYVERLRSSILVQNGRVISSSIEKYGRYKVGNLSARVPSDKVANVLATIKEGVVSVVTERTSIQDETGQYISISDQIAALEEEVVQIEAQIEMALLDPDSDPSGAYKRKLEFQLQQLQSKIKNLQSLQDSVEENVQYARIDVSIADGARYFDPSARLSFWELLETGWGMLALLWYFIWNTALLTALYMLIWLPVTFVLSLAWSALKSK
ncbi:MAG: hypothetical protein A3A82_03945 [Candidatus Pacebacteria bacterium RIFCSPLOWO2_01_FULL_47_12]|nr:MAG: hypothetical protein A3J60_00200 [Candidatus Pacebacteria bacterium RIFCSPHIGHO2_02_FULL_46_9]OGJ39340.1 MAG: hypothetical protein A3A82_03945 [Candidatus Pacebacteria bacterium RIFCSPLOWO2_01_FULL_47_12]